MQSNIKYQTFEERYLNSARECLIKTEKQEGTFSKHLNVDPEKIKEMFQDSVLDDPRNYKTTIIAIDTQKQDYVCGILTGTDFCQYIQMLKTPSKVEYLNVKSKIGLQVLKPLIDKNYKPGEFLIGSGFGVRSEYEDNNIGSELHSNFLRNSTELGYILWGGIIYNPKSLHIGLELGAQIFSHLKIKENNKVPEKYKKEEVNNDVFVIGQQLNQNIPNSKIPPRLHTPKL